MYSRSQTALTSFKKNIFLDDLRDPKKCDCQVYQSAIYPFSTIFGSFSERSGPSTQLDLDDYGEKAPGIQEVQLRRFPLMRGSSEKIQIAAIVKHNPG